MWIIIIWSPHSSPKRLTHSFDPSNGSSQGPAPAFGPVLRVFIIPIVVLKFDERKAERTDDGDDDAGAVDDATVGVSLTSLGRTARMPRGGQRSLGLMKLG
jgi:hypothetical protein